MKCLRLAIAIAWISQAYSETNLKNGQVAASQTLAAHTAK